MKRLSLLSPRQGKGKAAVEKQKPAVNQETEPSELEEEPATVSITLEVPNEQPLQLDALTAVQKILTDQPWILALPELQSFRGSIVETAKAMSSSKSAMHDANHCCAWPPCLTASNKWRSRNVCDERGVGVDVPQ